MILAADNPITPEVLSVGAVLFLLALWTVVRTQRRIERRDASAPGADRPPDGADPALADSMRKLLLQIEESHRKIGGAIDTRLRLLDQLVAQADKRIESLKAAADAESSRPIPSSPAEDPQTQEIYKMAEQGMDPVDIARKTNRQRGEIDLILSLKKLKR